MSESEIELAEIEESVMSQAPETFDKLCSVLGVGMAHMPTVQFCDKECMSFIMVDLNLAMITPFGVKHVNYVRKLFRDYQLNLHEQVQIHLVTIYISSLLKQLNNHGVDGTINVVGEDADPRNMVIEHQLNAIGLLTTARYVREYEIDDRLLLNAENYLAVVRKHLISTLLHDRFVRVLHPMQILMAKKGFGSALYFQLWGSEPGLDLGGKLVNFNPEDIQDQDINWVNYEIEEVERQVEISNPPHYGGY